MKSMYMVLEKNADMLIFILLHVNFLSGQQDKYEEEQDSPEDEEIKLTSAQKARVERNRQRALLLRQSRLAKKPYSVSTDTKWVSMTDSPKYDIIWHFQKRRFFDIYRRKGK